ETHILDLADSRLRALVAGGHFPRAGIAVNAYAFADLATQQLIHGQSQGLTRNVPERDFDRRQRGDILAGLRAGKDAGGADAFESSLDIERVLANQHARERIDDWHVAHRGVGRLALVDDALIGVDPDMDLVAVHPDFSGADIGDLQLSSAAIIKTRVWASFNQLAMRSPY